MIIFKDILSDAELFTDANKIETGLDGFCYIVHGKYTVRKLGEIVLAGANPSQEEQEEALDEEGMERGVDIVLNQKLEDVTEIFSKKIFQKCIMGYIKKVMAKLEKEDEKKHKEFKEAMKANQGQLKKFMDMFSDEISVFAPKNDDGFDPVDPDSGIMIGVWQGTDIDFYVPVSCVIQEKM